MIAVGDASTRPAACVVAEFIVVRGAIPVRRAITHAGSQELHTISEMILQAAQATLPGAAQAAQGTRAARSMLPPNEVIGEYLQFAGYFLAVGAIGFRFAVAGRLRETTSDALALLRKDDAAALGALGATLLLLSLVGGTFVQSLINHTDFSDALPRRALGRYEFRAVMLAVSFIGFVIVDEPKAARLDPRAAGVLLTLLQPVINLRVGGITNAVHVLAASTWLGTLLVMTIVGVRTVIGANAGECVAHTTDCGPGRPAFSPLALGATAVLLVTGVVTAWLHVKRRLGADRHALRECPDREARPGRHRRGTRRLELEEGDAGARAGRSRTRR